MNIDPLQTNSSAYTTRAGSQNRANGQTSSAASNEETDTLSTDLAGRVRASLAALPEIRADVVERGRQLRNDPDYPPQEVVRKIASLITPFSED